MIGRRPQYILILYVENQQEQINNMAQLYRPNAPSISFAIFSRSSQVRATSLRISCISASSLSTRKKYRLPSCTTMPASRSLLMWCTTVPLLSPNLYASSSELIGCFLFAALSNSINTRKQLLSLSRMLNNPKEVPRNCRSSLTLWLEGLRILTMVIFWWTNANSYPSVDKL
jgi:hypothetical protein